MPKGYNDGATVLLPAKTWTAGGFQIHLLQGSTVGCSCNLYHSLWGLALCDIISPSLVTDALYHHNVLNQPSLISSDLWWWSLNIPGVFVHEDIYLPRYLLFMPSASIFCICWTVHIFKHYIINIALNICTILNNVGLTKGNFTTFKHRF